MSAQGDCEFLVKRARELVPQDPYAAKAWLITARTLYPADFNIQYEMYSIERNAERTASAGRLLYDIFVNFPEQPVVWREIAVITAALRNDSQDKHAQFLKGVCVCVSVLPLAQNIRATFLNLINVCKQYYERLFLPLDKKNKKNFMYIFYILFCEGNKVKENRYFFSHLCVCCRSYSELLQRVSELCRYMSATDSEGFARCCAQIVTCCTLVLFHSAFHYVSAVQPSLFQGHASLSSCPWVLLEDLSSVYTDVEVERKHTHKKRKLADGREKTMSSDDEDMLAKGRGRHIVVNKAEMPGWAETLEHFRTARESWDLLHSHQSLETEFIKICSAWKTELWMWFRIFLTDMIIYQGQYRKALSSLALMSSLQLQQNQNQNSLSSSSSLETQRAIIQLASCHYALGEYRMACEKLLEVVSGLMPQNHEAVKSSEEQRKPRSKTRKGNDLRLVPCSSKSILPFCLQLMLACFKLRAFTDNRDDLALGHVVVLLQYDWPQGENLFLKAVDKICQQGSFQYENFFNYVTNIDMLEEFAYLRTTEGGRVQLELLPNQGMLIKNPSPALGVELNTLLLPGAQKADRHHTVTRGITKGVKEDFRLAMERQVSRCGENLLTVLHRFCINEKIILVQSLP
uniref:Integrator complex subunit 10 n=1 Tax=Sinocyclocheilus grahami TaxID=75366 RepID=A0A672PK14_SINGR